MEFNVHIGHGGRMQRVLTLFNLSPERNHIDVYLVWGPCTNVFLNQVPTSCILRVLYAGHSPCCLRGQRCQRFISRVIPALTDKGSLGPFLPRAFKTLCSWETLPGRHAVINIQPVSAGARRRRKNLQVKLRVMAGFHRCQVPPNTDLKNKGSPSFRLIGNYYWPTVQR